MPPQFIFEMDRLDLSKVLFDREQIRLVNPQRGSMEQLDAIVHVDTERKGIVGVKHVGADEFWVSGHIPGRPLLPGVLMIESAAQLACFYAKKYLGWKGFVGFNGMENVKFRTQVPPGKSLYLLGVLRWERHRRLYCDAQGMVDGALAFEAGIIGVEL
jgi:3-hydroxyacyl-[acyl-carrier-protein] dehydratase